MIGKRKVIDWEKVSALYRVGTRSLRDIAQEFGITEGAIRKRAKAEEWPRDLSEQVRLKADDLVRKSLVRAGTQGTTEKELKDAEASSQADVRTAQMVGASENKRVIESMIAELKLQNKHTEELMALIDIINKHPDEAVALGSRATDMFRKVLSFPGRADSAKKLFETWCKLVETERKVYSIDKGTEGGDDKYIVTISKEDRGL